MNSKRIQCKGRAYRAMIPRNTRVMVGNHDWMSLESFVAILESTPQDILQPFRYRWVYNPVFQELLKYGASQDAANHIMEDAIEMSNRQLAHFIRNLKEAILNYTPPTTQSSSATVSQNQPQEQVQQMQPIPMTATPTPSQAAVSQDKIMKKRKGKAVAIQGSFL